MKRLLIVEAAALAVFLVFWAAVGFKDPTVSLFLSFSIVNLSWGIYSIFFPLLPKGEAGIFLKILVLLFAALLSIGTSIAILRAVAFQRVPLGKSESLELLSFVLAISLTLSLMYAFLKAKLAKETEKLRQKEKELFEKTIESLKLRLNPHFLFNSLNTLAELIHTEPEKAEKFTIALAQYYRSILNLPKLWTLEEEIKLVQDYVRLASMASEKRISFKIEMDEGAKGLIVPSAFLQPLVENAVKYSKDVSGQVEIFLRVTRQEESWKIELKNPCGEAESSKPGHGMNIAMEKVRTLYPESQIIWKAENGWFFVEIWLPESVKDAGE